ncbi:hypothetical protein [Aliikangiella coralliicola]|nr:hypothetical protein [Aliikangiella coralliicola]
MKLYIYGCLLLVLLGCEPGTGEFFEDDSGNEPPPQTSELLSQIQQTVFTPICIQCHIGAQAPQGLRLESEVIAFQSLVNVAAVGNSDFDLVKPFDPENSYLVLKVRGDPRAGQRMPLGLAPLSDESIQLIEEWIREGALPIPESNLTKVISITREKSKGSFSNSYIVTFSSPLVPAAFSYDSIFLYEFNGSHKYLLTPGEYQIKPLNSFQFKIVLEQRTRELEGLTLVLNDPDGSPLIDLNNKTLDGDNDNQEGGRYEFHLELRNE